MIIWLDIKKLYILALLESYLIDKSALNKKIILILFFLILIPSVLATSIIAPYTAIYCNVDTEFLEKNICTSDNCTLIIEKIEIEGEVTYDVKNSVHWMGINEKGITIFGSVDRLMLNKTEINLLKNTCKEDISPVINRIEQEQGDYNDSFIYCHFSQNRSEVSTILSRQPDRIQPLGGGWYEGCRISKDYDLGVEPTSPMGILLLYLNMFAFGMPVLLIFMFSNLKFIFSLAAIYVILFSTIFYLNRKNKIKLIYLLPLLLGFPGGVIGSVIVYIKERDNATVLRLLLLGFFISFFLFFVLTFSYLRALVPI